MEFFRKTLSNGLRIITIPMPSFESATVLVMVGAGSRYENKNNNGISHFLEHMAFKGTQKRPSAISISSLIDGIGGESNAFTGKETTGYYIKSATTHVELSLDLLSDMLQHSNLDSKEIDKERGVILEEINMYEDTPMRKLGDIYEQLLYGDTPMGWDIAGTKEVINNITRENFVTYMNSLYSSGNITVVVSGGIDHEKVEGLIEKYFHNMKQFNIHIPDKVIEDQKKPAIFIKEKKTEQVHVALGVRTIPVEHTDHYALEVLSAILGGGMSSRLFHEVREKRGLAYYVRTNSDSYTDCGSLVSTAGLDPKRVRDGIEVMVQQYHLIKQQEGKSVIRLDELKKAKEYLKGHFVLDLEDSRSVASFYAHQELLETKLHTPAEVIKKIDLVTIDDVIRVANTYLVTKHLNLAIIGNIVNGQDFENLLKL